MDDPLFLVKIGALGVLASVPTLVIGPMLARRGIVREAPRWVVVALGMALMLMVTLTAPLWPLAVDMLGAAAVTLAICNPDLWSTFREGRWWWLKRKDQPGKHDRPNALMVRPRKPHDKKRGTRRAFPPDDKDARNDA